MKTSTGNNRLLLTVVASLGFILAVGWGIWLSTRSGGFGGNPHPYRILGAGVGEEAGKLAGRNASVVVIVAGGEGDPAAERNAKIFSEALAGQGLKVLATETIPLPELAMLGGPGKKIPGNHYTRLIDKHAGAAAVISLAGYPSFNENSPAPDEVPKVPFIAVVLGGLDPEREGPELQKLLQAGMVRLAVTRRGDTVPTSSKGSALRAEFEAHYQLLTAGK